MPGHAGRLQSAVTRRIPPPRQGAGELWCRLRVTWPGYLATHSTEQMVYVGDDGLIGRHDYDLEIAGNSRGTHCISRYTQAAAS